MTKASEADNMPEIILQHVTKRFDKFVAVQDLDLPVSYTHLTLPTT